MTTLNKNVNTLQDDNAKKANTINAQDKQLNTAWYVFGTKKELKEQNILVDGKGAAVELQQELLHKG